MYHYQNNSKKCANNPDTSLEIGSNFAKRRTQTGRRMCPSVRQQKAGVDRRELTDPLQEDEDHQHERRHDDEGHPGHSRQGEGVEAVKQQTGEEDAHSLHRAREGEHGTLFMWLHNSGTQ